MENNEKINNNINNSLDSLEESSEYWFKTKEFCKNLSSEKTSEISDIFNNFLS